MSETAGRFYGYLDELRRELYLRYGRTEASPAIQGILEEAAAHLDDSLAELVEAGADPGDAAAEALARFGTARDVAHSYADVSPGPFAAAAVRQRLRGSPADPLEKETNMIALIRDLKFAWRGLRNAPGYTMAFILTLGLGIGANTAIFSVVNGVLLEPLPYRDGHELMYVRQSAQLAGIDNTFFSVPEIDDYRSQVPSFEDIAEFSALTFTALGLDEPRRVRAGIVTGNYFEVMGFDAAVGRVIGPGDDGGAADPVAVLTHDYWHSAFGADPEAVGLDLRMNGRSVRIVGVAEPAPPYPERTDVYVNMVTSPHHLDATMQTDRIHRMTEIFARLAPGSTEQSARVEVQQVADRLFAEFPEAYDPSAGYTVALTSLNEQLASRAQTLFLILLGIAGFVLIIACANVANLTLARALRRRHELTVRASLGAARGALRRQLLMENLLPSLAGAALGLVLAQAALGALTQYAARYSVRAGEIALDGSVLFTTFAIGTVAACLFAFVPTLPAEAGGSGARVAGARVTAGIAGRRTQRGLVVAQVAACMVLLIGAGLLLRSLLNLSSTDVGLDVDSVVTMRIPSSNTGGDPEAALRERLFYESVVDEVAAVPGVSSAALGTWVPLSGAPEGFSALFANMDFEVVDQPTEPGAATPRAGMRTVTPGYFDTLGMSLVRGRFFADSDAADAPLVVVINQAMADAYFPDRDPIGRQIKWTNELLFRFSGWSPEPRTIVGVVSDSNDYGIDNAVPNVVFHPFAQLPDGGVLFVRTEQANAVIQPTVNVIRRLNPEQPVERIATLEQIRADSIAPQRLNTTLVGVFALLAVAIAAVGVAGVLAFSVSQRTQEMGVRAALGANRGDLERSVIGEGVAMVAAGLVIGGIAALGLARLVSNMLFDVAPTDPATFAGVAALLIGIAVAASWIPARRAARVDPVTALRSD